MCATIWLVCVIAKCRPITQSLMSSSINSRQQDLKQHPSNGKQLFGKTPTQTKIQLTKSSWDIMREWDRRPANISLLLSQQTLFLDVHMHNCIHHDNGTVHEPSVIFSSTKAQLLPSSHAVSHMIFLIRFRTTDFILYLRHASSSTTTSQDTKI